MHIEQYLLIIAQYIHNIHTKGTQFLFIYKTNIMRLTKIQREKLKSELPPKHLINIEERLHNKGVSVSYSLIQKVLLGEVDDNKGIINEALELAEEHKSKEQENIEKLSKL